MRYRLLLTTNAVCRGRKSLTSVLSPLSVVSEEDTGCPETLLADGRCRRRGAGAIIGSDRNHHSRLKRPL